MPTANAGPLPIALLTGLAAALAWGLVDVVAAMAGTRIGTLRAIVIEQTGSLLGLIVFVLVVPGVLGDHALEAIGAAVPIGVVSSLAFVGQFSALVLGPVAVVSPVIGAYGGFTVVLAILFRGEALTPTQAIGAVLATAGVILTGVVFDGSSVRGPRLVGPGVLAAVASAFLFALATVLLAEPISRYGAAAAIAGNRLGNLGATSAFLALATITGWRFTRPLLSSARLVPRLVALLVLVGMGDIAGFLAFGYGLDVGPVWLVGLLSSFGPVLAIIYGVVALRERLHRTQWVGMGLIAASLVVLALA